MGRKVLLTREQFQARFGYDPETESKEDAKPWTGVTPEDSREEGYKGPTTPSRRKVLLTKEQYIDRFGTDPDTGEQIKNPGAKGTFKEQNEWARTGFIPGEAQALMFNRPDDLEKAKKAQIAMVAGTAGGAAVAPIAAGLAAAGAPIAGAGVTALGSGAAVRAADAAIERKPVLPAVFNKDAAAEDLAIGAGPVALLKGLGAVKNAAKGAIKSAGAAAERRVAMGPTEDILRKAAPTKRENALSKLGGEEGVANEINSNPALQKASDKGPKAVAQEARAQKAPVGQEIGDVVAELDTLNKKGMRLDRIKGALGKLRDQAKEALDGPRVSAIDREIKTVETLAEGNNVKAAQVHKLMQRYGKAGFAGNINDKTAAKQLGRDMKAAVQKELHDYAEAVNPGAKAKLEALNAKYSNLSDIESIAKSAATKTKGGGLRDTIAKVGGVGGLAASAVLGSPVTALTALGSAAAIKYSPQIIRAADKTLAALGRAVKTGAEPSVVSQLAEEAIRSGVSPATVKAVVSSGR